MQRINTESDEGLGGTSDERFGPDAVLLVGFRKEEVPRVRQALDELGADFVAVVLASSVSLRGTLRDALASQELPGAPALGVPRVLFVSGMCGAEAVSVISAVDELGLPPCSFAAVVPRSIDRLLAEVLEEISSDAAATAQGLAETGAAV